MTIEIELGIYAAYYITDGVGTPLHVVQAHASDADELDPDPYIYETDVWYTQSDPCENGRVDLGRVAGVLVAAGWLLADDGWEPVDSACWTVQVYPAVTQ